MKLIYEFTANGNSEVTLKHDKTLEFTADNAITSRASCIGGTNLQLISREEIFYSLPVRAEIEVANYRVEFTGILNPYWNSEQNKIIFRKSSKALDNTLMVNCTKGAADIPREMLTKFNNQTEKILIKIYALNITANPVISRFIISDYNLGMLENYLANKTISTVYYETLNAKIKLTNINFRQTEKKQYSPIKNLIKTPSLAEPTKLAEDILVVTDIAKTTSDFRSFLCKNNCSVNTIGVLSDINLLSLTLPEEQVSLENKLTEAIEHSSETGDYAITTWLPLSELHDNHDCLNQGFFLDSRLPSLIHPLSKLNSIYTNPEATFLTKLAVFNNESGEKVNFNLNSLIKELVSLDLPTKTLTKLLTKITGKNKNFVYNLVKELKNTDFN